MREIKFRVYNDMQNYMEQVDSLDLEQLSDEENRPVNMHYMQYTGLKDKNGVEIYEGDIVKGKYNNEVIEWDNNYSCFNVPMLPHRYCEVIGNIHENKELLK